MGKDAPCYQDADLVMKLYDLRREAVMRESRNAVNMKFQPKSFDDFMAISSPEHPLNAPFRQVASYWEMVYGMVKNGIGNADYIMENNGEGIFLYAKIAPFLEQIRQHTSPAFMQNTEWVVKNTKSGGETLERVHAMMKRFAEQQAKQ